jgi:LacI family transcriptional regulator
LRDNEIPFDGDLVVRVGFGPDSAATAIGELLETRPDVSAIFAANNLMAEGAWQELRRRQVRVPNDISLVAFDDLPWMSMVHPAVTAVGQPVVDMGTRAATLLLSRLSGELTGPPRTEVLSPYFVRRDSAC